MKIHYSILTAAIAALSTLAADAALVTWGAATNIAGDTDVSTAGTLFSAFNFGPPGVTTTVVNGVSFSAAPAPLALSTITTTAQPLSSAYLAMLNTAILLPADTPVTLNLTGLTIGNTYLFQTWVNNSGRDFSIFSRGDFPTTVSDGLGNDVSLYAGDNGTGVGPGDSNLPSVLGQYVIGTFTADATVQSLRFLSEEIPGLVNGYQLRNITQTAVPEPGTALAGVMLAGLLGVRRRRS